jgi:transcriptional regulator with XRE-family HTH domain
MPGRDVDTRFAERMTELMAVSGLTFRALAARTYCSKSHLHSLARGLAVPTPSVATHIDRALGAGGELLKLVDGPAGISRRAAISGIAAVGLAHAADRTGRNTPRSERDAGRLLPALAFAQTRAVGH